MEPVAVQKNAVLTVPEVAEYLRVTTKTVYKLIGKGELTSFRIGRAVRCRRQDVERFITTQSGAGTPERV